MVHLPFQVRFYNGKPYLEPFVERIEIVDIGPDELEAMLECYLEMMLKLRLVPKRRHWKSSSVS